MLACSLLLVVVKNKICKHKISLMSIVKLYKTITPLLWRVIVFACLFVFISGIMGPRIISGGILFRDGFVLYGGIGKAVLFSLIAFALLARFNKTKLKLQQWKPMLLYWMMAAVICLAFAWGAISSLLAGDRQFIHLFVAHAGLLVGLIFTALSCIGLENMKRVWTTYRREISTSLAIGASFYVFLQLVYLLWQPLATVVLHSVNALLSFSGLEAIILPPNTLMFDRFGITIAEFCSGVESIALFTGLYAIVGLLDWKKLNKQRYFIIFPIALLGLCVFNILRVYGLIMAGYYVNPEIAFSLFHTYAGMVFFILYSAVFWAIAYKYLLTTPKKEDKI